MKKMFLLFILSFSFVTFASNEKSVWPRITVWPNGADIWIANYTNKNVNCSGPVNIYHASGSISYEYVFMFVFANSNQYKHIFNSRYNDPMRSAFHQIYCN